MAEASAPIVDRLLPDIVVIGLGVFVTATLHDQVCDLFDQRQDTLYSLLTGVHGTLLGFVLASLTIMLGYVQNERFEMVRAAGHFRTVFAIYLSAVRTETFCLVAALTGALVDREDSHQVWLASMVLLLTLLGLARLARVLWVTYLIVNAVIQPAERRPGSSR